MSFDVEVFGTAFNVHGTWYARLEGGGGVLLPLTGGALTLASLADNRAYFFTGKTIDDQLGIPRQFDATQVRPIGVGTRA